jgi:iron complex outermembrane recepter protein
MRASLLNGVSACLALCFAYPATAQDQPSGAPSGPAAPPASQSVTEDGSQIADIVVTAQRREESVQDVPIAITALSAAQLESRGISSTLQIGQFVPNLVAQNNTGIGSANSYFLRGLGSTETIATFDPPVGTYIDDIYLSRQNANNLSLFDVERVEVLRGPQGTLFGRNTTGGAINVIMRAPGDDFGGFAEVGYGRFNKIVARASVDLPLAPTFSAKVSGYFQDDKGYARNVTTGERLNDDDGYGVRLDLRGELADWARWRGSYTRIVSRGENILNFACNPANPSDCDGRFVTTGYSEARQPAPRFGNLFFAPTVPITITGRKATYGLGQEAETDIFTSNFQFDLNENTSLSLITGYVNLGQQFGLDFFDGRAGPSVANPRPPVRGFPQGGFVILNDGVHRQFSQEIKLDGSLANGFVDYVAGIFYIDERNTTDFADIFGLAPNRSLLLADRTLKNRTEAIAGYVQADFNVTDQFKLTAGVRYTDEEKTFNIRDNRASCNDGTIEGTCLFNQNLVALNGARIPDRQSVGIWTPRFAVNYQPNEDFLAFASATRGFKSGGWNARGTAGNQLLPFDPEKVWSYEAGFKSDWFDRRFRANVTAFYLDVTDLQIIAGLLNPTTGAITFLTRNFADYRNKGIEGEFTFVPVDRLNLYVNVGWQDDNYRIPRNAPATDAFGIQSVPAQQAACLAALAAAQIPNGANTAPAGTPPNNAPACANGVVTANGTIATPVRTPRWSLALGGSYELLFGDSGWSVTPSINASFRSRQEVAIANLTIRDQPSSGVNGSFPANPFGNGAYITGSATPSVWLVNASIALNAPNDRWRFTVECTNCFDEVYNQSSLSNYSYINPPMMWMARARYNF